MGLHALFKKSFKSSKNGFQLMTMDAQNITII